MAKGIYQTKVCPTCANLMAEWLDIIVRCWSENLAAEERQNRNKVKPDQGVVGDRFPLNRKQVSRQGTEDGVKNRQIAPEA